MKFIVFFLLTFGYTIISNAQMNSDFEIRPLKFNWIKHDEGETDLCAHGLLYLRIGNEMLSEEKDGEWTLSAVALNLLRSLKPGYSGEDQIEDFIVPCCGKPYTDGTNVRLLGCNQGIYWEMTREGKNIRHKTPAGTEVVISLEDYKKIVFAFADEVENFYKKSKPKDLSRTGYTEAWRLMWKEWHELRQP
ncbi:MAG TPA: hypothetical protein VEB40_10770 [Flavipsychrobacter sp.]|nr:hypothetical protein [Flavipsychrobacter sp.]